MLSLQKTVHTFAMRESGTQEKGIIKFIGSFYVGSSLRIVDILQVEEDETTFEIFMNVLLF